MLTTVLIMVRALGNIFKCLLKRLEIMRKIDSIQTTALQKPDRSLRRVQRYWRDKLFHLLWELSKKSDHTAKWYINELEFFQEIEMHKILWDFETQTDHLILARRTDLVIMYQKRLDQTVTMCRQRSTVCKLQPQGEGKTINTSKTKVMPSLADPINWQPLVLYGVNLKDMQSFVYLGSIIMSSGQGAAEVERCIGAARSTFVRLKRSLWGQWEISIATKGRIYQAMVPSILFYGCKTWPLRAVDLRKLEVFNNDCFHYILQYCQIVCPHLLYVVAWTSHLFHLSCSSIVFDDLGTQLDAQRESSSAMYFSPLLFLTGKIMSVGSWRHGPAQSRMT